MLQTLKQYLWPFDARYEDLTRGNPALNVLRDFTAGLVVAMVAIPLAMGFAMASGLRPEQGIVGGAVAGLIGALWGGSKYQVYGPTAAFIPVIAGIMLAHDHAFLVAASVTAAAVLMGLGLLKAGKIVKLVPHSIVVGFTIGIAVTIALSQVGEVFGFTSPLGYSFPDKARGIADQFGTLNLWAFGLAVGTMLMTRLLLKVSIFLPAPLIALGLGIALSSTLLADQGLVLVKTKYGAIPPQGVKLTLPDLTAFSPHHLPDLAYAVLAIVFVAAIESLLCSRMADRLANNKGTPFNPDRELWGQGWVMALVPLLNGFPHTGALARTATNIKLGALSPLAGIFKFALKLLIAFYLASWLERVPMACIAGILLYVSMNMVKREEVEEVFHQGRAHVALMVFTAAAVIVTDFLKGVLSALVLYVAGLVIAKARAKVPVRGTPAAAARLKASHAWVRFHGDRHHPAPAFTHTGLPALVRADVAGSAPARAAELKPAGKGPWLSHIKQRAYVARTSFVHPQASVIGRVVLSEDVHVAAGSSIRADEGAPFFIGPATNIQDGVVIHALKEKFVRVGGELWAVHIGRNVSLAHDALVHGPCAIGDGTFVGFKSTVHDSVVGAGCFIGHGAIVVGVEIPDGRFVPHGSIIDSSEKVARLPLATDAHAHFNEDVVEVNRGLAAAYRSNGASTRPDAPKLPVPSDVAAGWGPPTPQGERF